MQIACNILHLDVKTVGFLRSTIGNVDTAAQILKLSRPDLSIGLEKKLLIYSLTVNSL